MLLKYYRLAEDKIPWRNDIFSDKIQFIYSFLKALRVYEMPYSLNYQHFDGII